MKPFRKNVAIAIDGGGIKGVICTRALSMLEEATGKSVYEIFRLTAGTSTGSIISAGIAAGLSATRLHELYLELGDTIFKKSWRSVFWPLTHYRYPHEPLAQALDKYVGKIKMGDFWNYIPPTDVVITAFDLVANHTCFIKPWKDEYKNWPVAQAVLASSSVPSYFPVVNGRFVDGGVGAYANPCYLAAYEILYCLNWNPGETTLISLGTGRGPHRFDVQKANHLWIWEWVEPILSAFLQSADEQQVNLVKTFFKELDFRRFQVDLGENINMDDPSKIPQLTAYGETMGRMILNDQTDASMHVTARKPPLR